MLKKLVILTLSVFFIFSSTDGLAKVKKNKAHISKDASKKKKKKKKREAYKDRKRRFARSYKKSGNGPDLKALTTESPYADELNNGVNAVETNKGL